jgi:CMP-2-keto-3-deoxyoctulosonic acid synthetase
MKTKQLESMTHKLNDVNNKLKISKENVIAAKVGREPTEERTEVLKKVAELKAEEESLQKQIMEYEVWEKMKNETEV